MTAEAKLAWMDGVAFPIRRNETILEFTRRHHAGSGIPTLCDDERLAPYGACRVCSVEVATADDKQRRIVASCHTQVTEGMRIYINNETVSKLRKNIVELVLTDHPLDCLTCEVNGNCQLQDVAASVGIREVRYWQAADHQHYEKDESHAYMRMDLAKCINCSRCVRVCDEIQGQFVLSTAGRGFNSRIVKDNDLMFGDSSCVSCGVCADTCPTAAISDIFQSKSNQAEKRVRTVCSYCGVGCNLEVAVKDNKVMSINAARDAQVNQGHACLKGRYAFRFYNHPDRLRSPMIKRDGEFEQVSWDEAYDFIAEKLTTIKSEFGPDAIAGISSSRCTNEENFLMQKFIRSVCGTNNIDCCARVCHSPTAWGMQRAFGTGAATNSIADLERTDCMMVTGANPTSAHPVTGAKIKQHAMKGKTLIVVDPVTTELARVADYHLQLRPGTNVAVLNAMLHYIAKHGLVDHKFMDERCEGHEEFMGQISRLDAEAMCEIAGVESAMVEQAAIAYGSAKNAMSFHGLGVTEHSQGSKTVMLIANLAMITGNVGRRGVGVNPLRGQNNVQGAADMGCQPHQGAGYLSMAEPEALKYYEDKYGTVSPVTRGLRIPEMIDAAERGDLKAMWILGEDIAQTDPNTKHVIESISNLDLLVVQEIFLSETAKLADVILPGTSFLEKSGTFTNGERRVQRVNAAVPPLAGTRVDGQIIVDMMNRMGYQQPEYDAAGVLDEIADVVSFFEGATRKNLTDNGKQWPIGQGGVGTRILHKDSFRFGKGKFHYFEWKESDEIEEYADDYPLILTTGRALQHYNAATMTRRTANEGIVDSDVLLIHERDAARRGIDSGDSTRLFSERGEVHLNAEISEKVKPGVVFTTFHFPEHMVNNVTSNTADEETMCPEYKVIAVDVEKA